MWRDALDRSQTISLHLQLELNTEVQPQFLNQQRHLRVLLHVKRPQKDTKGYEETQQGLKMTPKNKTAIKRFKNGSKDTHNNYRLYTTGPHKDTGI